MPLRLFVDFDGTITREDVGNLFYRTFGGAVCDELVARFRAGDIGARECFRGEAAAMGSVDPGALGALVDGREIDPTFRELADFCRDRGVGLLVVSDGLDYYIRRILKRHGCADVPFAANLMTMTPDGEEGKVRISLSFPRADALCERCACCKRNIMLTSSADDDVIAYAGEGFSDRCPVRYADIVFAKDDLQTFCQNENISFYPYATFRDVTARLRDLLDRGRLRVRRRAAEERRAAFRHES